MTVAFVTGQRANAANNTGTTITATFPSTPTQNNLLVGTISTNDGTFTNPTGWSTAVEYDEPTSDDMQRIVYKVAGAGESTSVQATGFAGNSKYISIFEYSGTDTSAPFDVAATRTREDGVSISTVGPTATIANADSVAVAQVYIRDTNFPTAFSVTDAFTLEYDFGTGSATPWAAVATKILSSTTGPQTTFDWTTNGNAGGTIAVFKGAGAGGGGSVGHRTPGAGWGGRIISG